MGHGARITLTVTGHDPAERDAAAEMWGRVRSAISPRAERSGRWHSPPWPDTHPGERRRFGNLIRPVDRTDVSTVDRCRRAREVRHVHHCVPASIDRGQRGRPRRGRRLSDHLVGRTRPLLRGDGCRLLGGTPRVRRRLDGIDGTLLVQSTRDFVSPDTEDPDPTARVQFLAVCPDGTSFSWGAPTAPATITSTGTSGASSAGAGIARDNLGGTHAVVFRRDLDRGRTPRATINGPGSKRKERAAMATGQVTFDGNCRRRSGRPPDPTWSVHPRRHRAVVRQRCHVPAGGPGGDVKLSWMPAMSQRPSRLTKTWPTRKSPFDGVPL